MPYIFINWHMSLGITIFHVIFYLLLFVIYENIFRFNFAIQEYSKHSDIIVLFIIIDILCLTFIQ